MRLVSQPIMINGSFEDARTRLASQVADDVRTHFGSTVLRTVIPRSVRVSEAPSYGQTVMTYDPASSGALCYLDAAREIAERGAAHGATAQPPAHGATAQPPAHGAVVHSGSSDSEGERS